MIIQQKRYRAAGIAMFAIASGLLLCRIMAYFVYQGMADSNMSEVKAETLLDIIFSVPVQIGFCFLLPLVIYKLTLKQSTKQIFNLSNFKKTRISTMLLAVPMGACAIVITMGVSTFWRIIISVLGYNYSVPETVLPSSFNFGLLMLSVVLSCVLPAFCEEFAIRGAFLTSMKNTFANRTIIVVMAISFGLFHQNIQQVFYTAVFGGFVAYITLKTGSIFPAMIMHFINNFLATLLDYGDFYNWGGGFVDDFNNALFSFGIYSLILVSVICGFLLYGMTKIVISNAKTDNIESQPPVLYKPTLRDSAFLIGAVAITAISTIFTFAFGY